MRIAAVLAGFLVCVSAAGADNDGSSDAERVDGLRQMLLQCAHAAVDTLGVANGFLENPLVRIPLPGTLQKAESMMRALGAGKHADNLVTGMNRVAEMAVATDEARTLLAEAVARMPVEDPAALLAEGGDAATRYFRAHASERLAREFPSVVRGVMGEVDLARKYQDFVRKGGKFGLVAERYANVEDYIAQKALEALYLEMAGEERLIRANPGRGGATLQKVLDTAE